MTSCFGKSPSLYVIMYGMRRPLYASPQFFLREKGVYFALQIQSICTMLWRPLLASSAQFQECLHELKLEPHTS